MGKDTSSKWVYGLGLMWRLCMAGCTHASHACKPRSVPRAAAAVHQAPVSPPSSPSAQAQSIPRAQAGRQCVCCARRAQLPCRHGDGCAPVSSMPHTTRPAGWICPSPTQGQQDEYAPRPHKASRMNMPLSHTRLGLILLGLWDIEASATPISAHAQRAVGEPPARNKEMAAHSRQTY